MQLLHVQIDGIDIACESQRFGITDAEAIGVGAQLASRAFIPVKPGRLRRRER